MMLSNRKPLTSYPPLWNRSDAGHLLTWTSTVNTSYCLETWTILTKHIAACLCLAIKQNNVTEHFRLSRSACLHIWLNGNHEYTVYLQAEATGANGPRPLDEVQSGNTRQEVAGLLARWLQRTRQRHFFLQTKGSLSDLVVSWFDSGVMEQRNSAEGPQCKAWLATDRSFGTFRGLNLQT